MPNIICSYNPTLINKDDNNGDHGRQWVNAELTTEDFFSKLCVDGFAVSSQVNTGHRTTENFMQTNIIMIDVDDGMKLQDALAEPLSKKLLGYYLSPSCTAIKHKFRLVFKLPITLQEGVLVSTLRTALNSIYNGDPATIDPCRLFYGNNKNLITLNGLSPLDILNNELDIDDVALLIQLGESIEPEPEAELPMLVFDNDPMSPAKRSYIMQELSKLDLGDYHVWRNLACAMQSAGLSAEDYFTVSSCSKNECIKTWNSMNKKHSGKKITAGTLWYMIGGREKYNKARATGVI